MISEIFITIFKMLSLYKDHPLQLEQKGKTTLSEISEKNWSDLQKKISSEKMKQSLRNLELFDICRKNKDVNFCLSYDDLSHLKGKLWDWVIIRTPPFDMTL